MLFRSIVGNLKKWKEGYVEINFEHEGRPEHLRVGVAVDQAGLSASVN